MKIILLSGALKNSGDFLITERTYKLLKYVYPDAEIVTLIGNYPLDEKLDEINSSDVMVIAGGPSYTKKLYPRDIPLVRDLSLIKPKIYILGSGWYGNLNTDKEIWGYRFEESSKQLLRRVEKDSGLLGCRDFYAIRVLKANGFNSGYMTGCPAWYDIPSVSKRHSDSGKNGIKKIMVSDPADIRAFGKQSLEIVRLLRRKYPKAKIEYIFHRGIQCDEFTSKATAKVTASLISELERMKITYHDIAYGCEGFHLYDDCDLHIGHRVHAHIYNMSIRNRSVLLEEDSRGAGVNEVLCLWGIKAYDFKVSSNASIILKGINKIYSLTKPNRNILKAVETYIDYIELNGEELFNISYDIMEKYFKKMISFIEKMEKAK